MHPMYSICASVYKLWANNTHTYTHTQDPTNGLLTLAEQTGMDKRFQALSLGQGQAPIAKRMIENGVKEVHMITHSHTDTHTTCTHTHTTYCTYIIPQTISTYVHMCKSVILLEIPFV